MIRVICLVFRNQRVICCAQMEMTNRMAAEMPVPVNFEEALDEASVALAIVFDGMIIAKIHSHFKLLKT